MEYHAIVAPRRESIPPAIFRAYDVRGEYPSELNSRAAEAIARTIGAVLPRGTVVVAHDGRTSSPALSFAVRRGLAATRSRMELVDLGVATTPMFYFFVERLKAAGGIMVTASHNPKTMNGLKVVRAHAVMIPGTELKEMARRNPNAAR